MKGWKLYLTMAVVAATASGVTLMVNPNLLPVLAGNSTGTYTLTGKVMCAGGPVTGVWVETDSSAKGFANAGQDQLDVADGWAWQRYSKPGMPRGASYSLHVGCGYKLLSKEWAYDIHSSYYSSERLDLLCNDIHPLLEWLGAKSAKQIFKLLRAVRGSDWIEVPYETCVEVPQEAMLVPRTSVAPVAPLTPKPVATLPTLAPVPVPGKTTAPPPPVEPPPSVQVNAYDNYGTVTTAGIPMCRGNPAVPQSMPGGTVSQTFTVPSGVRTLTDALIQIDPSAATTAHLQVFVDGQLRTETATAAAGDTRFHFGPVPVGAGQQVRFSVRFTATSGKIITVYTVGGGRGTLSFDNTCPDGAPKYSTGTTALRAVIAGWS